MQLLHLFVIFSEFWYLYQFSCFSWFFTWFCLSYSLPTTIVFTTRWSLLLTYWGWSIKPLPNLIWKPVIFLWSQPNMVSVLILDSRKYGYHQIYLYIYKEVSQNNFFFTVFVCRNFLYWGSTLPVLTYLKWQYIYNFEIFIKIIYCPYDD